MSEDTTAHALDAHHHRAAELHDEREETLEASGEDHEDEEQDEDEAEVDDEDEGPEEDEDEEDDESVEIQTRDQAHAVEARALQAGA
jgi:hypothetical protein